MLYDYNELNNAEILKVFQLFWQNDVHEKNFCMIL